MATLVQSKYLDSPINIDDLLKYNKDGFDKTHLYLNITAKDEKGASSEKIEEVELFFIEAFLKNKNVFTWTFKNYSKLNIKMQVEIIDEKRDVIDRGEVIEKGFTVTEANIKSILPLKEYKGDYYYYRLRVFCPEDALDKYYPTRKGVLFKVDKDYKELKEMTVQGDIRYMDKFLMDRITNETVIDPNYLKKLINLLCNPLNTRVFKTTPGTRDNYISPIKHDSYAEDGSFGINEAKMQFTLKDVNDFISDKHQLNAYVNGKKIFKRDNNTQVKMDGISRSYLKESDVPDDATVELETFGNDVIDSEKILCKYLIETEEDVENIYTKGIEVYTNNIGKYFSHRDLALFVRFKNSNSWKRINPFRSRIQVNFDNEKRFSISVIVKDNYVPKIGNEIMVISNRIVNEMFYKINAYNLMAQYYQVPCYFVPVSQMTETGEVITEFMTDIENMEVFVNGYRLIPNVDFALINVPLHTQVPSMILFKDMLHFGSKVEVVYYDYRKNTYFFFSELPEREDKRAVVTLQDGSAPLIEGTFTIYANNKKVNNNQYEIINSKSLVLKNINTKKNIMIKFHHNEDELLIRLLDLYKKYPSKEDIEAKKIGQDKFVDQYIKSKNTPIVEEKDKDVYLGLKYVYQLDVKYDYFEQLYQMIKDGIAPQLDANNESLFTGTKENPIVMDFMKKLPTYFNHDISINANRPYNEHRFEDNVALFNPGRTYLINTYVDRNLLQDSDVVFNCNDDNSIEFLTYLNENMPLILPYINNNILIDCNVPHSKENYKGLK